MDVESCVVRIPNGEVFSEFQSLITELSSVDRLDLQQMFRSLLEKDVERLLSTY